MTSIPHLLYAIFTFDVVVVAECIRSIEEKKIGKKYRCFINSIWHHQQSVRPHSKKKERHLCGKYYVRRPPMGVRTFVAESHLPMNDTVCSRMQHFRFRWCLCGDRFLYRFNHTSFVLISIPIYGLGHKYFSNALSMSMRNCNTDRYTWSIGVRRTGPVHIPHVFSHVEKQLVFSVRLDLDYLVADIFSPFGFAWSEIKTTVGKLDQILIDERVCAMSKIAITRRTE